jgi:hypothetical protein
MEQSFTIAVTSLNLLGEGALSVASSIDQRSGSCLSAEDSNAKLHIDVDGVPCHREQQAFEGKVFLARHGSSAGLKVADAAALGHRDETGLKGRCGTGHEPSLGVVG